jgi:hypothetical protein
LFFFFCFRKKNVLVNDDKKGSSEKHYQRDQEERLATVDTAGNRTARSRKFQNKFLRCISIQMTFSEVSSIRK